MTAFANCTITASRILAAERFVEEWMGHKQESANLKPSGVSSSKRLWAFLASTVMLTVRRESKWVVSLSVSLLTFLNYAFLSNSSHPIFLKCQAFKTAIQLVYPWIFVIFPSHHLTQQRFGDSKPCHQIDFGAKLKVRIHHGKTCLSPHFESGKELRR